MNTTPEFAEREHDSGVKVTQHDLEEALDDLIDRLFEGKKVGYLTLDVYIEHYSEEIAACFISGAIGSAPNVLASLIRRELEDSDEVRERAAELAQEGE